MLQAFGKDDPAVIALPSRKYLLAAEIGTVPETLSRTLSKFRERGWILTRGNTITVLSPRCFGQAQLDEAAG